MHFASITVILCCLYEGTKVENVNRKTQRQAKDSVKKQDLKKKERRQNCPALVRNHQTVIMKDKKDNVKVLLKTDAKIT